MKRIASLLLSMALLLIRCPALANTASDMLAKADAYIQNGEYAKAFSCYQLVQKAQPTDENAYIGEANLHILLAAYDDALRALDAALKLNPLSTHAWLIKCRVDALMGDMAAFEEDALFAEVCGADLSEDSVSIAVMYANAFRYETAILYFGQADIKQMDASQRELYGRALVAAGKREEAAALGLAPEVYRNRVLDAAFEADALTLVQVQEPALTFDDFELPDALWAAQGIKKPTPEELEELKQMLAAMSVTTLSRSPSGNSGIVTFQESTGGMIVSYYNGKYRFSYPSISRGAADQYGNLAKYNQMGIQRLLGEEGVVYSRDGRYAAIYNTRISLQNMQFYLDPILMDLSTGELILTATYDNKFTKENSGVVTTACFSSDGRYFYYMLLGSTTEFRTALYRYDLVKDVTELCYSGSDKTYYPTLSETTNGGLLILRDTTNVLEPMGVVCMKPTENGWTAEEHAFSLPMRDWYCNRMMFSGNSGYAVFPGRSNRLGGAFYALAACRPDTERYDLNRFTVISETDNKALAVSAEEITALMDSLGEESTLPIAFPYHILLCARLSPDGHYVLLHTQSNGTADNPVSARHLIMMRLDDLAVREVRGIVPESLRAGVESDDYRPMIEWNTDTLIISTQDGIRSYRFQ